MPPFIWCTQVALINIAACLGSAFQMCGILDGISSKLFLLLYAERGWCVLVIHAYLVGCVRVLIHAPRGIEFVCIFQINCMWMRVTGPEYDLCMRM